MNKKTLIFGSTLLICVVLLALSYMQWNKKLTSHHANSPAVSEQKESTKDQNHKKKGQANPSKESNDTKDDDASIEALLANADEEIQTLFKKRISDDKPVNMLILGSDELEYGNPGTAERIENALKKHYDAHIETTVSTYDGDIANLMNYGLSEYVNFNDAYDVIILEPFTLRNHGVVAIEDEHIYIENLIGQFTSAVEEAVVVIHPTQPIFQAENYPLRVDALKQFANEHNYIYIDHWTNWPDYHEEAFKELTDEDSHPNNDGANIWATSIIDYFIAEKMEE